MKTFLFIAIITLSLSGTTQTTRADIIIQYKDAVIELTTIGGIGQGVVDPTDLEFHPNLSDYELWAISRGTEASGSTTVIFSDAGKASQTSIAKDDSNNWHFMSLTTGIAFSEDNNNFATSPGVFDANHDGGTAFTGPTLWSSDLSIYGEPSGGNGSHLDMLHESSYAQGICWEMGNVFWVYDGYIGDIVRYDFVNDHGAGGSFHSDGKIQRFQGLDLVKDPANIIPSHIVLDQVTKWLYVVDHGNDRVIRIDITTGSFGGAPSYGPHESLAQYVKIVGFDWEEVITTGLDSPSGIALINKKILVADHATGDIIVYQTEGTYAFQEWFRIVTGDPGITGIEISPDGRIFYANEINNKVRRIDSPTLGFEDYASGLDLQVYPNPVNEGMVTIEANVELNSSNVVVASLDGKIMEVSFSDGISNSIEFDATDLASGIYIVQISSNDQVVSRKLIVE